MLVLAIWLRKDSLSKNGFDPSEWADFSVSAAFSNSFGNALWDHFCCDTLTLKVAESFTSNILHCYDGDVLLWLTDVAVVSVGVEIGSPKTDWVSDEGWDENAPPSAFFDDLEFRIGKIRCAHQNIPVVFVEAV